MKKYIAQAALAAFFIAGSVIAQPTPSRWSTSNNTLKNKKTTVDSVMFFSGSDTTTIIGAQIRLGGNNGKLLTGTALDSLRAIMDSAWVWVTRDPGLPLIYLDTTGASSGDVIKFDNDSGYARWLPDATGATGAALVVEEDGTLELAATDTLNLTWGFNAANSGDGQVNVTLDTTEATGVPTRAHAENYADTVAATARDAAKAAIRDTVLVVGNIDPDNLNGDAVDNNKVDSNLIANPVSNAVEDAAGNVISTYYSATTHTHTQLSDDEWWQDTFDDFTDNATHKGLHIWYDDVIDSVGFQVGSGTDTLKARGFAAYDSSQSDTTLYSYDGIVFPSTVTGIDWNMQLSTEFFETDTFVLGTDTATSFAAFGGTIDGVTAGAGLTGGGVTGVVSLAVGAGTGITVNADDIATTLGTSIDSNEIDFTTMDEWVSDQIMGAVTGSETGISVTSNDAGNNLTFSVTVGATIESAEITDQTIVNADIDTTASNFVFDDAYRGTSAVADSLYATVQFVRDSGGGVGSVTDVILEDSLDSYFDTAAVVDTIQNILTGGGYLTAETDPTLTDDNSVIIGNAGVGPIGLNWNTNGADGNIYWHTSADTGFQFLAGAYPAFSLWLGTLHDSSRVLAQYEIDLKIEDSLDEYQLALADADVLTEAEVTDTLTARGFLTSETGDIEGVTAGAGLTGGGTSGTVTLTVGAGTGITVNADDVAATLGTDIVTGEIVDQTITKSDIDTTASNFVFDDAYRGTSATADSLYATVKFVRDSSGGVTLAVLNDTLTNYATVGELTNALNTEPIVAGHGLVWGTWGEVGYDWDFDINKAWAPNAIIPDTTIRGATNTGWTAENTLDNTHFTVEFIPGGYGGYEYWMCFTPLWNFRFEDVCIMVRNKADNWHIFIDSLNGTYDSLVNPAVSVWDFHGGVTGSGAHGDLDWECDTSNAETYGGTNGKVLGHPCFGLADGSFFFDRGGGFNITGKLGFDVNVVNDSTQSCSCDSALLWSVRMTYDENGLALATPVVTIPPSEGFAARVMNSPTVRYYDDSTYLMWGIDGLGTDSTRVLLYRATNFPDTMADGNIFSLYDSTVAMDPDGGDFVQGTSNWHMSVKSAGRNRYIAIMDIADSSADGVGRGGLQLARSRDPEGREWEVAEDVFMYEPEAADSLTNWDGKFLYRSDWYWVRQQDRTYAVLYYSGDSAGSLHPSHGGQTFVYFDPITPKATIWNPDLIADTVFFYYVDPVEYPYGIGIRDFTFETNVDGAYTLELQEWTRADETSGATYSACLDTLTTGAGESRKRVKWYEIGNKDEYIIPAGNYIYVKLPSTNVEWVSLYMTIYELAEPLIVDGGYVR